MVYFIKTFASEEAVITAGHGRPRAPQEGPRCGSAPRARRHPADTETDVHTPTRARTPGRPAHDGPSDHTAQAAVGGGTNGQNRDTIASGWFGPRGRKT